MNESGNVLQTPGSVQRTPGVRGPPVGEPHLHASHILFLIKGHFLFLRAIVFCVFLHVLFVVLN